ncbi:MAG: zinc ribbon domain-containing protein [Fervidobacterium sp.]
MFNKVQKRLKSNVRSLGTGKSHIFAGKVKCLDCKSTMQKTTNNSKRSYLRCKLYCISKGKLCTKHTIRLDKLESIISDKIKEYFRILNENEIAEGLNDMTFDLEIKNLEKELSRINNDIKTRDTALKNIYLDKTKGMITEEQF